MWYRAFGVNAPELFFSVSYTNCLLSLFFKICVMKMKNKIDQAPVQTSYIASKTMKRLQNFMSLSLYCK
jgi:hypothetical protein